MVDSATDTTPAGLDEMEPGPVLAGFLASIDVSKVSGYDRIVVLRVDKRMASHYDARAYRSMAAVSDVIDEIENQDRPPHWMDLQTNPKGRLRMDRQTPAHLRHESRTTLTFKRLRPNHRLRFCTLPRDQTHAGDDWRYE